MEPIVQSGTRIRKAKGYSLAEIKEVKLDAKGARKLGLRVDTRRSSIYEENVKAIQKAVEKEKKKEEYRKKGKKLKSKKAQKK